MQKTECDTCNVINARKEPQQAVHSSTDSSATNQGFVFMFVLFWFDITPLLEQNLLIMLELRGLIGYQKSLRIFLYVSPP